MSRSALPGLLFLLPVLAGLSAFVQPAPAQAQIRRCVGDDGGTIYTDKRCDTLGAVERTTAPAIGRAGVPYRYSCPASVQDLVYQLSTAIDGRDVNRLASLYYWSGQSTRSGYALMDRLDAVAQRPLVDVVPVFRTVPDAPPESPAPALGRPAGEALAPERPPVPGEADRAGGDDAAAATAQATLPPVDDYYPQTTVRRIPIGLRLEQTLSNGVTPSRTVFGLRRAFGCWWVHF